MHTPHLIPSLPFALSRWSSTSLAMIQLTPDQWAIIQEVNTLYAVVKKNRESQRIVELLETLIRISDPPLDKAKSWFEGDHAGLLLMPGRSYRALKNECGASRVRGEWQLL